MTQESGKGDGWIIIHEGAELGDGCHRVLARRRRGGDTWDLTAGVKAERRPGAEPGQRLAALLRDAVGPVLPETVSDNGSHWSPRHAVCARRLPFYNPPEGDAWLFEVFDCGANARYRFVAPVRMDGDGARITDRPAVLDWSAAPLHRLNVRFRLSLESSPESETKERVWSYAEFFSGSIAGEEGTFILLDDGHEVLRAKDAWQVKSRVVYSGQVFHTVLAIGQDGGVEMQEDEVLPDRPPGVALALQAFERKVVEVAWRPVPSPPAAVPGPAAHIWWPLHAGSGFPAEALKLLVADPESAGPLAVDSLERLQDFDEDLMQILQSDETVVRCRSLKCHESDLWQAFLCEMFRPRGDSGGAEAEAKGGNGPDLLLAGHERARCIVLKEKSGDRVELLPLDWKSPGIYRLNDLLGFPAAGPQSAERIADYLQYFCSSLEGDPESYEDGIPTFTILEPVPADRVTWNGADRRWHVKGIEVVYGEQVFAADFSIDKEGVVEMLADNPHESSLPAEGAVLR
ncbi:MAG TPA: hypothetical protein ENJ62_07345, partial [Bryobacterales bacterium]|nr:hypothetical protein [Bryobacterales bacterium]